MDDVGVNDTDKPGSRRGEGHAGLTHPVDAGHRWSRVLGHLAVQTGESESDSTSHHTPNQSWGTKDLNLKGHSYNF